MNMKLTPQEERLLARLKDEELNWRSRFGGPAIFLLIGSLLLWMSWDAPFAFTKLQDYIHHLPYDQREKLPWADSYFMVSWVAGVFLIGRAIFWMFDWKRRLMVKLLIKLSETPNETPVA